MQATALSRKVIEVPSNQIPSNNILQQVNIQMQQQQQKWIKQMQTHLVYNKNYARNNCINKTTNIANQNQPTNVCVNTEETPNERAKEERSQSDDNQHETHQVEPTSKEAAIATTEEPQNEERRQRLRKINAVCNFYKKKGLSTRHDR